MGQDINKDLMELWVWGLINTQKIQVRVCLPSYAQVNLSPIKDRAKRIGLEMRQMEMSPSLVFTEDLEYIYIKKQNKTQGHTGQSKIPVQNVCWKASSLGDKSNPGEERSA